MDIGQHTALGDGNVSQKLVQLLVVADCQLEMAGDDTSLLVVAGGVASQFKDFGGEVLEDCGEVDGSACGCHCQTSRLPEVVWLCDSPAPTRWA